MGNWNIRSAYKKWGDRVGGRVGLLGSRIVRIMLREWVVGRSGSLGEWVVGRSRSLGEWVVGRSGSLGEWVVGRSGSLGQWVVGSKLYMVEEWIKSLK